MILSAKKIPLGMCPTVSKRINVTHSDHSHYKDLKQLLLGLISKEISQVEHEYHGKVTNTKINHVLENRYSIQNVF